MLLGGSRVEGEVGVVGTLFGAGETRALRCSWRWILEASLVMLGSGGGRAAELQLECSPSGEYGSLTVGGFARPKPH